MLHLHIGSKNYSCWSRSPRGLLRRAGIAFDEVLVRFDRFAADSQFKRSINAISPPGKGPVLVHGALVVWDSLAIAEYLAETHADKRLWPGDPHQRARARSICAEM